MSSGAGAGARAGSGKKMLGAGAAPKQASSETLFKRPYTRPNTVPVCSLGIRLETFLLPTSSTNI